MALQKQIIDIHLAQSIDSGTDPKLTKGNLQLVNALVQTDGTVSKSPGRELLPKTTQLPSGGADNAIVSGLAVVPSVSPTDIKIAVDSGPKTYPQEFYAWDAGRAVWTAIGCATPCSVRVVAGPRKTGAYCDVVYGHNHILYITGPAEGVAGPYYGTIVSRSTGAILKENITLTGNITDTRIIADYVSDLSGGNRFVVVSPTTTDFWSWDPTSTSAVPAKSTVAGYNVVTDSVFAGCGIQFGPGTDGKRTLVLATHIETGGVNEVIQLYWVNPTTGALTTLGAQQSIGTWAHAATLQGQIAITGYWSTALGSSPSQANTWIIVGIINTQHTYMCGYSGAGAVVNAPGSVDNGGATLTFSSLCGHDGGTGIGYVIKATSVSYVSTGDAADGANGGNITLGQLTGVSGVASGFAANGHTYVPLAIMPTSGTVVQNNGIICDIVANTVLNEAVPYPVGSYAIGRLAINGDAYNSSKANPQSRPVPGSPGVFAFCIDYEERFDSQGVPQICAAACLVSVGPPVSNPSFVFRGTQRKQNSVFACMPGPMRQYDGRFEDEFHNFPDPLGTPADGSAGNVTAGLHYVVAVYEFIDRSGNRHQSAPSVAVSWTAAGSKKGTVAVPSLTLVEPDSMSFSSLNFQVSGLDMVTLVVYMTTTTDAVSFYRAGTATNIMGGMNITVTVNLSDANLALQEKLVSPPTASTTSGPLPSLPSPNFLFISSDENRFYGIPTDDPSNLWYSQPLIEGWGVQWNPLLTIRIPGNGPLTGFCEQDGNKVCFKADAIYAFAGDGPNGNGVGGFSTLRKLPETNGCVDSSSVVPTPKGIIYKSAMGFMILGRNLVSQYLGKQVQKYNSNHVLSGSLAQDNQRAYFVLDNGVVLVYDFRHEVWSTLQYGLPPVHGAFCGSAFTTISADGAVQQDNPSRANSDQMLIETGWIKLQNVAGYNRIWEALILGDYPNGSQIMVQISYDFDPSIKENVVLTANGGIGGVPGNMFRLVPTQQRCTAMKLIITDFPDSGNAINLNMITAVIGIDTERGARVPAATQG